MRPPDCIIIQYLQYMISVGIKYKDSKAERTTFYLVLRKDGRTVKIAMPFKESARDYDTRKKEFVSSDTARFSNEILARWRAVAMKEARVGDVDNLPLEQIAYNIRVELGVEQPVAHRADSVLSFYRKWLLNGTARKSKANRGNVYHCRVFEEYLSFISKTNISFDEVTYGFYEDFISWLRNKKNYKENTVGSHIKDLKAVLNEAYKQKLHDNADFLNFYKPQVEVDKVFFTEEEIDRLYHLDLTSPMQDKVRDIIILGCYVAQRHSDYSVISKDDIKEDGYIHITQRKGGNRIVIPVHPIVREILDKYNGYPPQLAQAVVNREIKHIAKAAGMNEKIQVTEIKGGEKKVYYKEKWEMVSTHTARRSGITNALLAGVPRQECMYLSGHKTESAFNKYICITKRQYAEKLANTDFFSHSSTERGMILDYVAKVYDSGDKPAWLKWLIKEMNDGAI